MYNIYMTQETANQRLERILQENNLTLSQEPSQIYTVGDGSLLIKPPLYKAQFIDAAKEVHESPREETPTETHE